VFGRYRATGPDDGQDQIGDPVTKGAPVGDALAAAIGAFDAAGIETPRLDAEVLLSGVAGIDRAALIAEPGHELGPSASRAYALAVRRRLRREPVAYILGRKGFRMIELEVDPRVLIPRPETEHLVELAVELEPATVLEIGTGSGAIALAVADELPGCRVTATDSSGDALEVARANRERLGLSGRVDFLEGTLPGAPGSPGPAGQGRQFDLILANLPYVAEDEVLAPEISEWEPHAAVFSGPSGYEAFESVVGQLGRSSLRAGAIGLEIGRGQQDRVSALVRSAGFGRVEVRDDLAGIGRVVAGFADPE
jgi:release factor glutamine methyltransferase